MQPPKWRTPQQEHQSVCLMLLSMQIRIGKRIFRSLNSFYYYKKLSNKQNN